jgi:hypothetical protein
MIEGLQYKLHMMGIPIDGPCNVFCDNNALFINLFVEEERCSNKLSSDTRSQRT